MSIRGVIEGLIKSNPTGALVSAARSEEGITSVFSKGREAAHDLARNQGFLGKVATAVINPLGFLA